MEDELECPGMLFGIYIDYLKRSEGASEELLYDLICHTGVCDDCSKGYKRFVDNIHKQNIESMRKRFPRFVDSLKEHQIQQLWNRAESRIFNLYH